jgi:hypothetical protein
MSTGGRGGGPPGREDGGMHQDEYEVVADTEVDRTAASVYGIIVAGSVLAAGAGHTTVPQTAVAVVVTVVVYWLAESYAHLLATRVVGESPARLDHLRHRLHNSWPLVTASFLPVGALLVAALLGASDRNAVTFALLFTTALLALLGWTAGRRTGRRGLALAASTVVSGLIGLVLIVLKLSLH